jgi:hypothetical protein
MNGIIPYKKRSTFVAVALTYQLLVGCEANLSISDSRQDSKSDSSTPVSSPTPVATPTATPKPTTPSPTPIGTPSATPKPATPSPTPSGQVIPSDGPNRGVVTARLKGATAAPFGYAEYLPYGYNDADPNQRVPLIVFYVGMGELGAGTTASSILTNTSKHGPLKLVAAGKNFPAVVLAPQYSEATAAMNCAFLTYAISKYNVDPNRVYITGLSAGGYASSMTAYTCPEKIAAIVPIAVNIDVPWPVTVNDSYAKLATWGFHNRDDNVSWYYATPNWVMSIAKKAVTGSTITYPTDNNTKGYLANFDVTTKKMVFTEIPNNTLFRPSQVSG